MLREDGQYAKREPDVQSQKERTRSAVELTVERLKEAGVPPEKARIYAEKVQEQKIPPSSYFNQAFRMYIKDEDEQVKEADMPEGDVRKTDGSSAVNKSVDRTEW